MLRICPECKREYSSQSTTCRFCNCALIDKNNINSYQKNAKTHVVPPTNQQITPKTTPTLQASQQKAVNKQPILKKSTKKNKISFISLFISGIFCLLIIAGSSKSDNNKSKTVEQAEKEAHTTEQQDKEPDNSIPEGLSEEETIQKAIENVIGEENLKLFTYVPETKYCFIKFKGTENLSNSLTISSIYMDMFNILETIQPMIDADVIFKVDLTLFNKYGESKEKTVIEATFNNDTVQKINFEYTYSDNIPYIADEWWNHDVLESSE